MTENRDVSRKSKQDGEATLSPPLKKVPVYHHLIHS